MAKLPQDPWDYTIDQMVVVLGDCLDEHQAKCFRDNNVTGKVLMEEGDDRTSSELLL